jgi:predicted RNA-binding protein with PIN domain
MALLIDGYNLLHATNLFGAEEGSFQKSREALITFLVSSLTEAERAQTRIIFDAADAPPGLPSHETASGIQIRYARDYPDADSLIEELLEDEPAPRGLLVISSDHRVQRAARRRGAQRIDSERWYSELWQRRVALRQAQHRPTPEKPIGQLSPTEIAYWVEEFVCENLPYLPASPSSTIPPSGSQATPGSVEPAPTFENPFPPGYADDLLEEEKGRWDEEGGHG